MKLNTLLDHLYKHVYFKIKILKRKFVIIKTKITFSVLKTSITTKSVKNNRKSIFENNKEMKMSSW